jgi:hypothetical protein
LEIKKWETDPGKSFQIFSSSITCYASNPQPFLSNFSNIPSISQTVNTYIRFANRQTRTSRKTLIAAKVLNILLAAKRVFDSTRFKKIELGCTGEHAIVNPLTS